jgi:hypothetical protein
LSGEDQTDQTRESAFRNHDVVLIDRPRTKVELVRGMSNFKERLLDMRVNVAPRVPDQACLLEGP